MSPAPFREMYTLTDAVELIGRRLYGESWMGLEYMYAAPCKSPDEIANERRPLEEELKITEEEIAEASAALRKTLNERTNRRLAQRRKQLDSRVIRLRASLSLDHPLNDIVIDNYNSHIRDRTAKEALLHAIREHQLTVHDGRGRQLNGFVWADKRFRYYLELSIVVNSRSAGGPRRQPARIDKEPFESWLLTLKPMVEPPREHSPKDRLTEFLQRNFAAMKGERRMTKQDLRGAAMREISGVSVRMFDLVWASVAPAELRKPGARPKALRPK